MVRRFLWLSDGASSSSCCLLFLFPTPSLVIVSTGSDRLHGPMLFSFFFAETQRQRSHVHRFYHDPFPLSFLLSTVSVRPGCGYDGWTCRPIIPRRHLFFIIIFFFFLFRHFFVFVVVLLRCRRCSFYFLCLPLLTRRRFRVNTMSDCAVLGWHAIDRLRPSTGIPRPKPFERAIFDGENNWATAIDDDMLSCQKTQRKRAERRDLFVARNAMSMVAIVVAGRVVIRSVMSPWWTTESKWNGRHRRGVAASASPNRPLAASAGRWRCCRCGLHLRCSTQRRSSLHKSLWNRTNNQRRSEPNRIVKRRCHWMNHVHNFQFCDTDFLFPWIAQASLSKKSFFEGRR